MAEINDFLGLTDEDLNNAEASVIMKEFKPLPSGVYAAKIKDIFVYTNKWGNPTMKYTVSIKDEDGVERIIGYQKDINRTLHTGEINGGYAGRVKQFAYAAGVDMADLKQGPMEKIKIFGEEVEAKRLLGMIDKPVKALVKLVNDTSKEEGEPYKLANYLHGVVKQDGTQADGKNGAEAFLKTIEKTPIFKYTPKKKAASSNSSSPTSATAQSIADAL